jgi:CBS domain containing-hemolysin-like protein
MISDDRMKLRMRGQGPGRPAVPEMQEKPEWLLSTTLVGKMWPGGDTDPATALAISLFGERNSWLAAVTMAPLIWIFGEVVPKSIFQHRADSITPRAVFFLQALSYLFWPLLILFTMLTWLVNRIFGGPGQNPFTLREESSHAADAGKGQRHSSVVKGHDPAGLQLFRDHGDAVMVPLIDVVAIEEKATCGEALRVAAENAHVRLPVYDERIDRVVGVLNTLEL